MRAIFRICGNESQRPCMSGLYDSNEITDSLALFRSFGCIHYTPFRIACSKRSDSGERCEVKNAMKSRGGLGREVWERL